MTETAGARATFFILAAMVLCPVSVGSADDAATPHGMDGKVKVTLFADAPTVVTPIGATVDKKGRLLVIESNTHFRPKDYQGAETDRILLFPEIGGDKSDKVETYFTGMKWMMNIATDTDDSLVVSSRYEVFRLKPSENPNAAGEKVSLVKLDTKSDYPHNGLHGLAVDKDHNVSIGLGENFGGLWTIIGTDGRKVTEDIGAGSIFKVDGEGKNLVRLAKGFWNPFGLCVDPVGNLWAVDNDPDGRPPCRLIDVLPAADYGFEFRFGRNGMHPLQAWNGELPGVTGMVAGVGEAPVALLWRKNRLLVSSWRDHVVQSIKLTPHGAGYTAEVETLISGGESFRPTGLANAPDGALFIMDWASSSYSVNGKGRIWKAIIPDEPGEADQTLKRPPGAERAAYLRQSQNVDELIGALDDRDPVLAQAAVCGLSRLPDSENVDWKHLVTPEQKIGMMTALLARQTPSKELVSKALADPDDRVRQMAVRGIVEGNIKDAKPELEKSLNAESISPRLLAMTVAALNYLNGDGSAKVDPAKLLELLLARINAPGATDQTKTAALKMLQANHPMLPADQVKGFVLSPTPALQIEGIRYLISENEPARFDVLAQVAGDVKMDGAVRAEAVTGLADDAANRADLLLQLATDATPAVRQEALRSLRPLASSISREQRAKLDEVASHEPSLAELVHRAEGQLPGGRPPETDIDAWQKLVDQAPGDPEAGRRLFFQPAGPGCYKCHMIEGRGRQIGPDLTMIGQSQTREHVLESILQPSKEIAPLFTMWSIRTKSGQQIDGMLLRRDGQQTEVYVDSSGVETRVAEPTVTDRRMRKESLMPNGLVQGITDQEVRDLVAYLMQRR